MQKKPISDFIHDKINNVKEISEYCTFSNEPFFRLACSYYKAGMKVLDVGAGRGDFVRVLGNKSTYLLDSNPRAVEILKSEYPNVFLHTLPNSLPFEDKFFDLIHCSHIIEHLYPQDLYSSLLEFDRCLNLNGYLVISTPLIYSGFYDDLSHIKPYSPWVLIHYLIDPGLDNRTRKVISSDYSIVRLQYRYTIQPFPYFNISYSKIWLQNLLIGMTNFLRKINSGSYQKTGYTIIFQKCNL